MSGYLGEFYALLSALAFALFNVTVASSGKSRGDKGVLFSVIVTILLSLVLFLVVERDRVHLLSDRAALAGLAAFAAAGVCAMALGRTLVFESIRRLGPTRASAVKRLNPFFSVLLAAIILTEPVAILDLAGLLAIAVAFALLVRESLGRARAGDRSAGPSAYAIGAAAALAYAFAYIFRKLGLESVDAPALGTLVSALAGLAAFGVLAVMSAHYRPMFTNVFRHLDRIVIVSAVMVSVGQILMFAALAHASVTVVVMISSLEIFFSIFLSAVILRTEPVPGPVVLLAAGLAVSGVLLVAAG